MATAKKNHEELVEILQEGRINYLEFVLSGEDAEDFQEWCRSHSTDPTEESAEFYVEQTDIARMDSQLIDDEDYGVWN
ncbi:hypothetical protein HPS57_13640 [Prevotella sp. PINT]|jgi:hypothetical protein|uniref:hypothetical protein n=1 Tax=Bacteroidales TaxID=171549 RepID=UPI001555C5BF|nr:MULTISPECIES: hypothetical protein [Bacteroidales]NPD83007.1 hypothetical protein [Palleniella intestinalis]